MYAVLGWLNIGFIAVMTAPYWIRFLNDRTLRLRGGGYAKIIKVLRAVHKPLGAAILLIALVHGWLALGELRLHTGTIAGTLLLIAVSLGGLYSLVRKRALFVWHKRFVLLLLLSVIVHLLSPGAVYSLFRI
ncbi:MAG: hypothetical protein JW811_09535 [Clostridiales bacterium]|nr:hypothetical protein [Clostridiales bacterium]